MNPAFATLSLLLLMPLTACAGNRSLVEIQVVDLDHGSLLERMNHRGRDYIAGAPGHRFSVALQNRSGERVLAVLSVDGVNAISGQTASTGQTGYVLEPWQRIEVNGWRKSYSDVAEFYFTDLPDSYAARTDRPDNVGVIAVAVFRERRPEPVAYAPPAPPMIAAPGHAAKRAAADSAGNVASQARQSTHAESAAPSAAAQQLGTGHGQRRYDPAMRTHFERASRHPAQRSALYYDAYEALVARGVIRARSGYGAPDPFPVGFTPDPH